MLVGTYSIVAEEISSRGLHCKYFKNFSGSQSFNRALILKEVLDQLPAKYDTNVVLTKGITVLRDIGKHNLKELVFIDPYVMKNLTAYIQRKPLYRTMEPIVIGVDVYLIKNVFHIRVVKISSRYQTAHHPHSYYSGGLELKIPNDHYYFIINKESEKVVKPPESLTLGQLVAAKVNERIETESKPKSAPKPVEPKSKPKSVPKPAETVKVIGAVIPAKPNTLLDQVKECVKKVQDTLAQHKVEYQSEKVIDIGVCNSIKPILCIKFESGYKLEVAVSDINLVLLKSYFKYNVLKLIFE